MPFALSPAISIAIAIAILVGAFAGGFAVADWRKSGQLEDLKGTNNLLTQANAKCATDIKTVQAAVKAMEAVSVERERQAVESMKKAQPEADTHRAKIIKIRSRPTVALDMQCEAVEQEQIEYVQARREDAS